MTTTPQVRPPSAPAPTPGTDPAATNLRRQMMLERMRDDQSLPNAVFGGLAAALIGSAIWAAVTLATGYQIGWMAIGVAFLVGYTIRKTGKGIDRTFGMVGAAFSLLGCAAGNFFSVAYVVATLNDVSVWEVLGGTSLTFIADAMATSFQPMDLLFYGLALYAGYKYSFRSFTEAELKQFGAA